MNESDEPPRHADVGLPAAIAVPVVRSIALRHGMQRVLERLAAIPPGELATACNAYAGEFRRGETPLVLVDSSLLRNFKGGMLLTGRALYSSRRPHAIPLTAIWDVKYHATGPHAGCLAELVFGPLATVWAWRKHGRPKAGLAVNDEFVFLDGLNWAFWVELLETLAGAARGHGGFAGGSAPVPGGWG